MSIMFDNPLNELVNDKVPKFRGFKFIAEDV